MILLTLGLRNSFAQSFCLTPEIQENALEDISPALFQIAEDSYVIRIYVHIMRKSDGTAGRSVNDVKTAINNMVNDFVPHNICISLLGIDEINNTTYYNQSSFDGDYNSDGKFDNFSPNSHSNAIDIYIFDINKINGGIASGLPGTALAMGGTAFGSDLILTPVLSHEFGHCLGLFHTFHGSYCASGGCPELVNGSNCNSCGDYVCDTPSDPQRFQISSSDCSWNGIANCMPSTVDANGDPYNPNTSLIMAYTLPSCMSMFTNGQELRMREMLQNSSILQPVIVPDNLTVSSLLVTGSSVVLYDVIGDLAFQTSVEVANDSKLTAKAGESITINSVFQADKGSVFIAEIDDICSSVTEPNSARMNSDLVSFNDSSPDNDLGAYPNPISKGDLNFGKIANKFVLLNAFGVEILRGNNSSKINIDKFPRGIYILNIDGESQKVIID